MILEPSDLALLERLKRLRHAAHTLDEMIESRAQAYEQQRRAQADLRTLETEIANALLMAPALTLPEHVTYLDARPGPTGLELWLNTPIREGSEDLTTFCLPLTKEIGTRAVHMRQVATIATANA